MLTVHIYWSFDETFAHAYLTFNYALAVLNLF